MYGTINAFSIVFLVTLKLVSSKMVELKVHHDLPNPGYNINSDNKEESKLNLRMKPSNFTGPDHFKSLIGKCFKFRDTKYEYELCPFHNITQEDIQSFYSPYKGALGVWGQWLIVNNTFSAMEMVEGSGCGQDRFRSTKVFFKCSNATMLIKVEEPEKCHYQATLATPLVCGQNAMVVYPRLPEDLQLKWDQAATDLENMEITEKGYNRITNYIFTDAGYLLDDAKRLELIEAASKIHPKLSPEDEIESLKKKLGELENTLEIKENRITDLLSNKKDSFDVYNDYYHH